jgi:phosphoribosylglycinamide formyltransferase-1
VTPVDFVPVPVRLVVLASGTGSTLQEVINAAVAPDYPATVVAAGSDRPGCLAMQRAVDAGLPTFTHALSDFSDRSAWNSAVADDIAQWEPGLVVLAGFMRVLSPETVNRFKIINTHPSLLPSFPGAHAIRDALVHGVAVTGVTVHWVDAGLDSGQIIAQTAVPVLDGDTAEDLLARVQAVEKPLFIKTIRQLCNSIEESSK